MMRTTILLLAAVVSAWAAPDGSALYARHCARCHEAGGEQWSPARKTLQRLPGEAIFAELQFGMMSMVATLAVEEKKAIAEFLAGKPVKDLPPGTPPAPAGLCAFPASRTPDLLAGPRWNGWGVDPSNSRFQPADMAGLEAAQIPRLKLKWAFGYPLAPLAWSPPTVAGGRVFVGSVTGTVYSLDARTGCTWWTFQASPTGVRSAITIGPGSSGSRFHAYFGDISAWVYAVDALSGKQAWKVQVDAHPLARVTGAPVLHAGVLYVPVASFEEMAASNPKYECCSFRGSVVALDAATGKQIWKTHTIAEAARPMGRGKTGTQMWGPSGAGVWMAPTLDPKRGALYVGTGDSYSDPDVPTSDAILALDMKTGRILWSRQMTVGDRWNVACISLDKIGCPEKAGPDFDFASPPILRTLSGGRRLLIAGQKSGIVHAIDPDNDGAIVWQGRAGKGGVLGGIEWGMAADEQRVYAAVSDLLPAKPETGGGLMAIQIATGERIWHAPAPKPACLPRKGCSAAQPAAVTLIPGAVFSGSMDGHLRAYSSADGKLIWDFDTLREFPTVNAVPGQGGSLNGPGPTVVGGMLYVNSGYGVFGMAGNVLLAFSVDGK